MKKMMTTILIITVCLAANIVVSAEFVTGEMSLSQASETFGGGCCTKGHEPSCASSCSGSGLKEACKDVETGYDTCNTQGTSACGDCNDPTFSSASGPCS